MDDTFEARGVLLVLVLVNAAFLIPPDQALLVLLFLVLFSPWTLSPIWTWLLLRPAFF